MGLTISPVAKDKGTMTSLYRPGNLDCWARVEGMGERDASEDDGDEKKGRKRR